MRSYLANSLFELTVPIGPTTEQGDLHASRSSPASIPLSSSDPDGIARVLPARIWGMTEEGAADVNSNSEFAF